MSQQTWWYMSRASGLVAWVVLGITCLWGILLVTRMLKPVDRPAWLLDLHRWLGALAVTTTGVHLATLVADNYVHFGWREILVPQASDWKRVAVSWGVVAFYLLVVIQLSSLLMKRLPRRLWHGIHLLSYVLFAVATVHGLAAGSDHGNTLVMMVASGLTSVLLFASVARFLQFRAKRAGRGHTAAARPAPARGAVRLADPVSVASPVPAGPPAMTSRP
jgi:DMSO/TMAO reductase YedYZ heme-binding membrane subunit